MSPVNLAQAAVEGSIGAVVYVLIRPVMCALGRVVLRLARLAWSVLARASTLGLVGLAAGSAWGGATLTITAYLTRGVVGHQRAPGWVFLAGWAAIGLAVAAVVLAYLAERRQP